MGAEAVEYMITKKHSKIKLTISVLVHIPCKGGLASVPTHGFSLNFA